MIYADQQKRKDILIIVLIGICIVLLILGSIYLIKRDKNGSENNPKKTDDPSATEDNSTPTPIPTPTPTPYKYINKEGLTIEDRFNAPDGFERISVEEGSFAEYLRTLPLKPYGERPLLYNKTENESAPVYAVIDQQICGKDIQQCVDTVMRLWAEYLYKSERYSEISFDFFTTPVFKCDYMSWVAGKRVSVDTKTNKCSWYQSESAKVDDYSYETFTKYLEYVYVYANTNSYKLQTAKIEAAQLQIGDMIIANTKELNAENPTLEATLGHAMIIVDIAENAEGKRVYLIAEGNTPATQPYVAGADNKGYGGIWAVIEDGQFHSSRNVNYPLDAFRRLG